MNRNDMRSVVYLIIALICFYYLIDDFFGKNKISTWVNKFVGDFGGTAAPPVAEVTDAAPATSPAAAAAAAAPAHASENLSPAPQPLIPIPKPATKPATQPKTKTGSSGLSLPDIFHGFNPFPTIGGMAAIAGGAAALTQLPRIVGQELEGAF
jgi:hypothetical protein